jgi:hypothetical protein
MLDSDPRWSRSISVDQTAKRRTGVSQLESHHASFVLGILLSDSIPDCSLWVIFQAAHFFMHLCLGRRFIEKIRNEKRQPSRAGCFIWDWIHDRGLFQIAANEKSLARTFWEANSAHKLRSSKRSHVILFSPFLRVPIYRVVSPGRISAAM